MPKVSQRGLQTPASPIRKLVPFAEAAKKRGVHIFHLNIGQPDIITPKVGMKAVRAFAEEVLEYSHSAGIESYRHKLVDFYADYNVKLGVNDLIVTNGGSEALMFAMMGCLDEGDEIIVPEPFYANYNGFAKGLGINIRPISASIETGFALPSAEAFEALITPKTKAILICHPGNPTGYLYSKSELEALGKLVRKHDLYLISDEVYRDFCYDGREHISIMTLEGIDEYAVIVDSVSKRYSACGVRIGIVATRNKNLYNVMMKFAQARLSPSTLGQVLAEALIESPQSYFDEVRTEYDKRRKLLVSRLQQMEGVVCPEPKGAFYAMVKLPIDDADAFCQWLLESFELDGKSVMLAPGTGFYSTEGMGKQEVRLAYVLNEQDLTNALDCLEEALKIYPGRTLGEALSGSSSNKEVH